MYIPKTFQPKKKILFFQGNTLSPFFFPNKGETHPPPFPPHLKKGKKPFMALFPPQKKKKDMKTKNFLTFQGPPRYISPSWYETSMAVPTWNYVSIHIYERLEVIENQKIIFDSLNDMVNNYEKPDSSYNLNEIDSRFIEGMTKGIVAFKINITKIEAKAKLSQNHPVERQQLVIKQLENSSEQNNLQIASLMKKNLKEFR